ncbi:MAG: hypothetical protein CME70_20295 [Halobacteriovorax sp.]|nr:hypothetical protein [Halobacteriovorax sp.]
MIPRICLIGATGFVGKGLICAAHKREDLKLTLSSRSTDQIQQFLNENDYDFDTIELNKIKSNQFDIIINAAGVCDPKVIQENPELLFKSHRDVDELIIENLRAFPKTLFFNLSSGAVYGADFLEPAPKAIDWNVPDSLEDISGDPASMYSKTKIFFEKKHRDLKDLNIVDVRLFSIFHRHLNIGAHYFLSQLIESLKNKEVFVTSTQNIVKDYVHPVDLLNLAIMLWEKGQINCALDLSSAAPVKKSEIIEYFEQKHQLKVEYKEMEFKGTKVNYYSTSKEALELGFSPLGTSLECIAKEMEHLSF